MVLWLMVNLLNYVINNVVDVMKNVLCTKITTFETVDLAKYL